MTQGCPHHGHDPIEMRPAPKLQRAGDFFWSEPDGNRFLHVAIPHSRFGWVPLRLNLTDKGAWSGTDRSPTVHDDIRAGCVWAGTICNGVLVEMKQ